MTSLPDDGTCPFGEPIPSVPNRASIRNANGRPTSVPASHAVIGPWARGSMA